MDTAVLIVMALTEHISEEIFDRYAKRNAGAADTLRVQTHIGVCDACRTKLERVLNAEKAFASVHKGFVIDDFANEPQHLSYEQLEFFVDNRLDDVEREITESHLAICTECAKDLADLRVYRKIADASASEDKLIAEMPKHSFWQRIFAFDSIRSFAPVAAILLIVILLGVWILIRVNRTNEIAKSNENQNASPSNNNLANQSSPAPQVSPEDAPVRETNYALNDGRLKVDDKGNVKGLENLSSATQSAIKQSLQTGNISVTNHSLGGSSGGVLMGEGDADKGVPFGLETPIGKVVKENQPVLKWKPLKDAVAYSVAIVDDKFNVVAESGKLTTTSWKPSNALARGANYSWQVTATKADGTEIVSPSSPAPQARFRIIEQNLLDDINRLEKSGDPSHLALGVLYAKAGLKREARAEFEKLLKENPDSPLAQKLLQSIK